MFVKAVLTEMVAFMCKNTLSILNKMVCDSFVITMLPMHVQRLTISMRAQISPQLFEILYMYQICPSICQLNTQLQGSAKFYFACVYKIKFVVRLVLKLL